MSLRSPLGRVLGLGSAKEGASHWWTQRVTSVALLLLTPWFVISLLMLGNFEYQTIVSWIANPFRATLLVLMVATAVYHSQLGMQVIVEDYFPNKGQKLVLTMLSNFFHVGVGALGIFAILRVAFGDAT